MTGIDWMSLEGWNIIDKSYFLPLQTTDPALIYITIDRRGRIFHITEKSVTFTFRTSIKRKTVIRCGISGVCITVKKQIQTE